MSILLTNIYYSMILKFKHWGLLGLILFIYHFIRSSCCCNIQISVVSQFKNVIVFLTLFEDHDRKVDVSFFKLPPRLPCTSDTDTDCRVWHTLNMLIDQRLTSHETQAQIWKGLRQPRSSSQDCTTIMHCLQRIHYWLQLLICLQD